MIYLLYFSTGYLLLTSLILLRNRVNFTSLVPAESSRFTDQSPKVSICIPARNEEQNIEPCLQSVLQQDYPNIEILVLDDRSGDATGSILARIRREFPYRLTVLEGEPKPEEWLGKPWACHQLSEAATGDILVFADADVRFEKDTISRVVRTMGRDVIDFLTVWPKQELASFWERVTIPLVYYALLSLLPSYYVYRSPRWMPNALRRKFAPLLAAACGQFMAFKKAAYKKIDGHRAVRGCVVEDVELARIIRRAGFKMRMYYGGQSVSCRMYYSGREIKNGFRKNFLAGFSYNVPGFVLAGVLHILVYLLPWFTLAAGLYLNDPWLILWSSIPILITFSHRIMLAFWFDWNPLYAFLHPISVLWFQWLAARVLKDHYSGYKPRWKGREV